jgi:alpha-L-arabinofuranosidase
VQDALDVLEYTTIPSGTALSDLRVEHGRSEPFEIGIWCLGNEMDGPWQLGHRSADDYGRLAAQAARGMRQLDDRIQLVVCGSSSSEMPSFGTWERTVLEHTYDEVDFISCHAYYSQRGGDRASFLASAVDMDRFIDVVAVTADHVKAVKGSDKTMYISFDEWNIWDVERYHEEDKHTAIDDWPVAPRLLEDSYSVLDAVVFGSLLISLLKHADRVRAASLAQLVNVIAPIMTEPGGIAWRQTTFFPFALTSRLARGVAIEIEVECATYPTERFGAVPLVDAVATWDEEGGTLAVFLVNRDDTAPTTVAVRLAEVPVDAVNEAWTLHDEDLDARNTLADPERVAPRQLTSAALDGAVLTLELAPASWSVVALGRS